jgi:cold shock CspA family protein
MEQESGLSTPKATASSAATGEEVFVHLAAIKSGGYRSLRGRQAVQFDVTKSPKGMAGRERFRLSSRDQRMPSSERISGISSFGAMPD